MVLGTLDFVLLSISLLASIVIGVYFSIMGMKVTPLEYLLGGRSMKPLPLALSLTVGTVSAITIMGSSGEVYTNGTQLWLMDIGVAIGLLVVSRVLIPVFYPLQMVSLYQYIEKRFGSKWFRKLTVLLTICGGVFFIALLIIPPALFLQKLTGLDPLVNIAITGLCCSVYSAFGGVKAVVYTDVFQSVIMVIGALSIVIQGCVTVGGFKEVWRISKVHNRVEFFNFDLNPYQRHSFWLVIVYGFFFSITTYGVNQNQTQRAFCTGSVREAQRVLEYTIIGTLILKGLFSFSGLVIFAKYAGCDPLLKYGDPLPNVLISVTYVTQYMTQIPGLSGLFISSIYAAVLSSVSTQVNSITALLWEDFLKGYKIFQSWTENGKGNLQKCIALVTGIGCISLSLAVANIKSFLQAVFRYTGTIWSPMLGLFTVALFLPWVKSEGALSGFIVGIIISVWICIGQQLTELGMSIYLPSTREFCRTDTNASVVNETHVLMTEYRRIELYDTSNITTPDWGFYRISYCLNHVWGAVACIILSVIVTYFKGCNIPEELDSSLIHPWAWNKFVNSNKWNKIFSRKGKINTRRDPVLNEISTK